MHHHVSDPARLRGGPTVGFALCRPADMCAATCWGVCRPYEPARQDPAMTLQQQAVPESYIAEQFLRATEDHLLGTRR